MRLALDTSARAIHDNILLTSIGCGFSGVRSALIISHCQCNLFYHTSFILQFYSSIRTVPALSFLPTPCISYNKGVGSIHVGILRGSHSCSDRRGSVLGTVRTFLAVILQALKLDLVNQVLCSGGLLLSRRRVTWRAFTGASPLVFPPPQAATQ